MNTPENLDAILRRVQKLLAIAQDDRANPAEAAAAASMAEKVMRKYQLENADVLMATMKQGDGMATEDCVATAKTNGTRVAKVPLWASWLAVAVSKLNNVGARMNHHRETGEACIRFYGFAADVAVSVWTFNYLVATINRLSREFRKTEDYVIGGRQAANAYRQGVTHGIMNTLNKLAKEKEAEAQTTSKGRELVVVKTQAVAQAFGGEVFETKKTHSQVKRGDSFVTGFIDGKAVDVNRRAIGTDNTGPQVLAIGRTA